MIIYDVPQRSAEWHQIRCGRLTGSAAADMLATIKSGEAAARRDLRLRLVCERLTGTAQEDGFVSPAMQHGMDTEDAALAAYEAHTGHMVRRVGFLAHDTLLAGCSPDGVIGDYEGILEVKCPKSATHLRALRANVVPADYRPQILHNLWITGAAWCDFASFDPRFPRAWQFWCVRVPRVPVEMDSYELMVRAFLAEVDAECAALAEVPA